MARIADLSAEIDMKSIYTSWLDRLKRSALGGQWSTLFRQKRAAQEAEEVTAENVLSREKRNENDLELSRQKQTNEETENPEKALSRQKRNEQEEGQLSREKRVSVENEVHREAETQSDQDELEIQLLGDQGGQNTGDSSGLSSPQHHSESLKGYEIVRTEPESSAPSPNEPGLLRHKYSEAEGEMELFSPQKRDLMSESRRPDLITAREHTSAAIEGEKFLSRQKRDLSSTMAEQPQPSSEGRSRQRREPRARAGKDSSVRAQPSISRREAELLERIEHEPEHKNYHELLLLRRMKDLRGENKRRKKNQPELLPEDEDGWEQELRIRNELAEKAIEHGIQQRKERIQNPDPNRPLSVLQRIKQDAEEILRRRAEEEEMNRKKALAEKASRRRGSKEDEEEEEEEEEEAEEEEKETKKDKKKTEKSIRQLLNLQDDKKKDRALKKFNIASAEKGMKRNVTPTNAITETNAATQANATLQTNATQAKQAATSDYDETILRFGTPPLTGKAARKDRKKMKKHNRAAVHDLSRKNRDAFFKSIGLPALRVSGV